MTIADDIRDIIVTDLSWPGDRNVLTDDYALIDNGVIDSLGIFQLLLLLEERYGIEVDDEDLVPENFETVGAIAQLVGKRG